MRKLLSVAVQCVTRKFWNETIKTRTWEHLGDNHVPNKTVDNHIPKIPGDNHVPKNPGDNHVPKKTGDNHVPKKTVFACQI